VMAAHPALIQPLQLWAGGQPGFHLPTHSICSRRLGPKRARIRLVRLPQRERSGVHPFHTDAPRLIPGTAPQLSGWPSAKVLHHTPSFRSFKRQVPGSKALPVVEWHHQRMRPALPSFTVKGGVQSVAPFGPRLRMTVPIVLGWSSYEGTMATSALQRSVILSPAYAGKVAARLIVMAATR